MTAKLSGNSLYSASLINKEKHRLIEYSDDTGVNEKVNDPRFVNLEVISPGIYEVRSLKKKIINNLPIQIGLFVYLNAKLTMLRFLYDFLFKFCQKEKISLLETDTDSYYCALAERELDDCVKAEKRLEYFTQKPNYLVVAACEKHKQNYIETKVAGRELKASSSSSSSSAATTTSTGGRAAQPLRDLLTRGSYIYCVILLSRVSVRRMCAGVTRQRNRSLPHLPGTGYIFFAYLFCVIRILILPFLFFVFVFKYNGCIYKC